MCIRDSCYPVRKAPTGPVETFGSSREMAYEEHVIDTEDICMVLLRYEDGALGELMVSQVFAGAKNGLTISVAGQKQSATWEAENCCELSIGRRDAANGILTKSPELLDPQAAKLAAYPGGHGEGFPDAFKQHFHRIYQHILHPERPADFASFSDGRRLLLIGEKLLESAKCGRSVSYTHLDVYKRQGMTWASPALKISPWMAKIFTVTSGTISPKKMWTRWQNCCKGKRKRDRLSKGPKSCCFYGPL